MTRKPLPGPEEIEKLPSDGGEEFNRLIFERSPYLLQHARNPVDWYPWGEEAFAVAKKLNRMIFLSVGYSTCHWCHVMEHESFEDPEVARLMNENFVCIKVDREERPDIDALYMKVTQAMTGSGGWPMTVIMTPERKPFFAGTYFPKGGSGAGRRSGMLEIIPQLAGVWKDQRNDALDYAEAVTTQLRKLASQPAGQGLTGNDLDRAVKEMTGSFDPEFGGFRGQRKFPLPHKYLFLLRNWHRTGDEGAMHVVEKSLESMRLGGMWDHIGYGFHRYSTDPKWLLPHFEKMLYDQALLAWAYTEAWQCSGNPLFRSTAEDIYKYVLRDMTSSEGGFFSAEDADSQGEEGLFYTWTTKEIYKSLSQDDAVIFCELFGFSDEGNYTDEATREKSGRNIIHLKMPLEQAAQGLNLPPERLKEKWDTWRDTLFKLRLTRVPPLKDDKVLTDWNGLMIASMARAGRAFQDRNLIEAAEKSARFAMKSLRRDDGALMKRWRGGIAGLDAHLDDYAFMILGLIELHQSTRNSDYLQYARELSERLIGDFRDKENHGFFLTASDSGEHIAPIREIYDGAIPSGNSVAALALLKLARITGNTQYQSVGENVFKAFSDVVSDSPSNYAMLMCALDFHLNAGEEIVIVAPKDGDEESISIYNSLASRYAPNSVIIYKTPSRADALARLAPFTEYQEPIDGKTTIYICRDFTCKAPVFSLEDALKILSRARPE